MFLIRVLWTSRLKHRAINQWRMSRASPGEEGKGEGRGRGEVSLCTCINSELRYGSFVLVNRANLPACVMALWIYAAPFVPSRYSNLVLFLALPPPPPSPLFPPLGSSFADISAPIVSALSLFAFVPPERGGPSGPHVFHENTYSIKVVSPIRNKIRCIIYRSLFYRETHILSRYINVART